MHLIYFMRVFIIASVAQLTWINCASAFTCYDATGNTLNSGAVTATANVYVNLQPSVAVGQNLVVDLSSSIFVVMIIRIHEMIMSAC